MPPIAPTPTREEREALEDAAALAKAKEEVARSRLTHDDIIRLRDQAPIGGPGGWPGAPDDPEKPKPPESPDEIPIQPVPPLPEKPPKPPFQPPIVPPWDTTGTGNV